MCRSPPPSSSAVTVSPVAALTSGGPARKIVPCFSTMIVSSDIAGHIGAARRARAHHHRDLRDVRPPTSAPDCRRCGQNARGRETPRPDAADWRRRNRRDRRRAARSPRDLLRAQMLLDRHRIIGAALDRRIVGDDHRLAALDRPIPAISPAPWTSPSYMPKAAARRFPGTANPDRSGARRARAPAACRARHGARAPLRAALGRLPPAQAEFVNESTPFRGVGVALTAFRSQGALYSRHRVRFPQIPAVDFAASPTLLSLFTRDTAGKPIADFII